MTHIKKLMARGYITRRRVRNTGRGVRYSYKWHAEPLSHDAATLKSGGVVTTALGLPELPIDQKTLDKLTELFVEWVDTMKPLNGDHIAGTVLFRRWLNDKLKEVKAKREGKINARISNSSGSTIPRV